MSNTTNKASAYVSISFVCIFWGISFISTKICFQWFTPFSLAAVRFIMATAILFIVVKLKEKNVVIQKGDYKKFFLAGFMGVFLYFAFENVGLKYLPASLASILLSAIPAFAVTIDFFYLKIPFTRAKFLSILLSIFGVALVVGFNVEAEVKDLIIGSILMLLSALSWVLYSYMTTPLHERYSSIVISYYQNLFGALCFIVFLPFAPINLTGFNAVGLINVLFLGIICSALCYLLYNYAIKILKVMVCSVFINVMPIVTIVASVIILDEKVTLLQLVGASLIIASVFLITKPQKEIE